MDTKELIGKKFGKLTVLRESNMKHKLVCKCDCGNIREIYAIDLINGHTKSCGCMRNPHPIESLIGKKFGKLTVLDKSKISGKVICKCDCGNVVEVFKGNLLKGNHTTSCGCAIKEIVSKVNFIHGGTRTKLYYVYYAMKNRCYREKDINYKNYGGKGITVCEEWLLPNGLGFKNFKEWAYNNGYFEAERGKCTLERIDYNKNYCPENCKFIPGNLQAINKSNNKSIPFNNEMHTISEVARATGILPGTISSRLRNTNMSIEEVLTPPEGTLRNGIYFVNDSGQIIAGADDPSTIDYNNYIPKLGDKDN